MPKTLCNGCSPISLDPVPAHADTFEPECPDVQLLSKQYKVHSRLGEYTCNDAKSSFGNQNVAKLRQTLCNKNPTGQFAFEKSFEKSGKMVSRPGEDIMQIKDVISHF